MCVTNTVFTLACKTASTILNTCVSINKLSVLNQYRAMLTWDGSNTYMLAWDGMKQLSKQKLCQNHKALGSGTIAM